MNKFKLNLVDNVRTMPECEVEYCSAQEFFEQMDDTNKKLQQSLNECLNIGEGAL